MTAFKRDIRMALHLKPTGKIDRGNICIGSASVIRQHNIALETLKPDVIDVQPEKLTFKFGTSVVVIHVLRSRKSLRVYVAGEGGGGVGLICCFL